MAEVAEKELESFVVSSLSYVKDTTNFLNKVHQIRAITDQNDFLYLGCSEIIPQKESIQACREGLNLRSSQKVQTQKQ